MPSACQRAKSAPAAHVEQAHLRPQIGGIAAAAVVWIPGAQATGIGAFGGKAQGKSAGAGVLRQNPERLARRGPDELIARRNRGQDPAARGVAVEQSVGGRKILMGDAGVRAVIRDHDAPARGPERNLEVRMVRIHRDRMIRVGQLHLHPEIESHVLGHFGAVTLGLSRSGVHPEGHPDDPA
jgi:hypothetical protein